MGLQPVRPPDPARLAVLDPHAPGHQPPAPVRCARGLLLERAAHDLGLECGRDPASPPVGPGPVLKPRETLVLIPVQPALIGWQRDADPAGQGQARQTLGRAENGSEPRPMRRYGLAWGSEPSPRSPCGPQVAIASFVTIARKRRYSS